MPRILLTVVLWCFLSSTFADNAAVPVMVGGEEGLDACTGLGVVSGLTPGGDGFLAVRSGMGANYQLKDKLLAGQQVFICDSSADGKWLGVVYSKTGQECGVHSPVSPAQPYNGKCHSGWVSSRWIKVIAG